MNHHNLIWIRLVSGLIFQRLLEFFFYNNKHLSNLYITILENRNKFSLPFDSNAIRRQINFCVWRNQFTIVIAERKIMMFENQIDCQWSFYLILPDAEVNFPACFFNFFCGADFVFVIIRNENLLTRRKLIWKETGIFFCEEMHF